MTQAKTPLLNAVIMFYHFFQALTFDPLVSSCKGSIAVFSFPLLLCLGVLFVTFCCFVFFFAGTVTGGNLIFPDSWLGSLDSQAGGGQRGPLAVS